MGAALGSAWGFLPLPGAGATMTSSSGAVDDAPPGVAEALLLFALAFAAAGVFETLLLFALAFAAGGCAEGSRLAALAFAAGGSDAARGGARGTDVGVGASFVAGAGAVVGVFIDAITFLSRSFDALSFNCASFRSGLLILTGVLSSRPASSFHLFWLSAWYLRRSVWWWGCHAFGWFSRPFNLDQFQIVGLSFSRHS